MFTILSVDYPADNNEDPVSLGRKVYIQEGCINCHSQYIRPLSPDVSNFGPYRNNHLNESPPLIGNRRQGPDLLNVGLRRSMEWNKLHLINPQVITQGSRMPSYRYLFTENDDRGINLLHYLNSLGQSHKNDWDIQVNQWEIKKNESYNSIRGKTLYDAMCIQCHGNNGNGKGIASGLIAMPIADFSTDQRPFTGHISEPDKLFYAVSRIIKFGIPGLPMPGHEYLTDDETGSLAKYIIKLMGHPFDD